MRIAVITSDAPVSEHSLAWGMCHVNTRLLKALDPYLEVIFVCNAQLENIDPQLRKKSVPINRPFIVKILRKLAISLLGGRMHNARFRFILPALVRKLKEAKAQWVFCPCGSNPFDLERAVLLARASRLPLAVYLVDDFVEGARLSGDKERLRCALDHVPGWILSADKIFVISEGFRLRIKELYHKDAEVLPLGYDLKDSRFVKIDTSKEDQIIFVGNLSHFYVDGLKKMASVLDELNKTAQTPVVLRLTLPDPLEVKRMIGDFNCIRCVPCKGLVEVQEEISRSLMSFVPYSFDPNYRIMAQTSFPSKILLCLAASRNILVYGPEDSSSVRYFRDQHLPTVVCQEDLGALRDIVVNQMKEKKDYSGKYRQVVQRDHASSNIVEKFISGLYGTKTH